MVSVPGAFGAIGCLGAVSQLEVRVLRDPMLGFPDESPGAMAIASPQTWDELAPQLRAVPMSSCWSTRSSPATSRD